MLERAGGSLLTTPLVKALFYLDCRALLETGRTVTGVHYVALKAGPVVENYGAELIDELERHHIALQEDENPDYKPVVLLHPTKHKFLDDRQVALASEVAEWVKGERATALSSFSHRNPGWIAAWEDGFGKGSRIDLRIAMQQLVDEDPWIQEEGATEEEKQAFARVESAELSEW